GLRGGPREVDLVHQIEESAPKSPARRFAHARDRIDLAVSGRWYSAPRHLAEDCLYRGFRMRCRFVQVLLLLGVLAGAYAGVARALDFDDEDPEPPPAEIGYVYHYEIGTHAGCLPHKVRVGQGELPPGLTLTQLNDHTALVSGIATEAGVFSAWLFLTDCSASKSAEALFRFNVYVRRWGIATGALTSATAGSPYSFKLEGQGVPSKVTWTITAGALPAGLTLGTDGTISGTPTEPGSSTFTVQGSADSTDPASAGTRIDSRQFTLSVVGELSAALSRRIAEVGVPVRSSLVASGGQAPYTWSATGVPAGLQLGSDGSLTGAPKRSGVLTVSAHVVDANGTAKDVQVRLVVRPRLALATKFLRATSAGRAYSAILKVRGGAGGLQWSVRGAPAGLRMNAATGRLSGVPAAPGRFRVTVRVRDALGAVSTKRFVLSVN
ncbi:MAG: Ig domain-containing protein, partial [Gaiellaceae bacterium]